MGVDDFVRRNRPSRSKSKLEPYQAEIRKLREKGYSWQQVADYLHEAGLPTHPNTVSQWWDRHNKDKSNQPGDGSKLVRENKSPQNNYPGRQGLEKGLNTEERRRADPDSALEELLGECSESVPGMKIPHSRSRG